MADAKPQTGVMLEDSSTGASVQSVPVQHGWVFLGPNQIIPADEEVSP